jgi:tetratricopeptide (TPR) repeat protein
MEWLAVALFMGPTPVLAAISRWEHLLDTVAGRPDQEIMVRVFLANLMANAGQLDRAHDLMARARELRDQLGAETWFFPIGYLLLAELDADPVAAERELTWGYELQRRSGERSHFSTIATWLARATYAQGRLEEAERLTQEAEAASRPNDVQTQILGRATRAKLLARKGEFAAAEALGREAVAFAATSDFLDSHGDALVDLAEVLCLAEQPREAATELARAVQLFDQKGNFVSATRARSLLYQLT